MRIALFTDTYLPQINGVTKTLDKLTNYLEQQGIEYMIFAPQIGEQKNGLDAKESIQWLPSFSFFMYSECRVSLPNYFKIRDKLNDFNPDLIHLVTPFNLGLCGLKYARTNSIPLVASYHTNFTHYLEYYNLDFLENIIWKFMRWFHQFSELNFCPSQTTLQELKEQGVKNLEIWGRGIDTELYSPEFYDGQIKKKYGLENKLTLLYVGRVAPEKNLQLLLDSLKRINPLYKSKVELVITGDGPLLEELKSQAPENVTFTGYLTGQELRRLYASADIFTFPSVTETYGNVVLEAMASGLPVVGILAGGVKENLQDGYNGLACNQNEVEEFSEKLARLVRNNSLRRRLAANAYQYALTRSWERVFSRLVGNYQTVINCSQQKNISA